MFLLISEKKKKVSISKFMLYDNGMRKCTFLYMCDKVAMSEELIIFYNLHCTETLFSLLRL